MTSPVADIYLLDFGKLNNPSKVLSCLIYIELYKIFDGKRRFSELVKKIAEAPLPQFNGFLVRFNIYINLTRKPLKNLVLKSPVIKKQKPHNSTLVNS